MSSHSFFVLIFFFNDTATTEIYTLSLHDALPILKLAEAGVAIALRIARDVLVPEDRHVTCLRLSSRWMLAQSGSTDRKSTRLNSSHRTISYAVFCLKKKKKTPNIIK